MGFLDNSWLFNLICSCLCFFDRAQKQEYREVLERVKADVGFFSYHKIIDVGCGTGALSSVLAQGGLQVTGV